VLELFEHSVGISVGSVIKFGLSVVFMVVVVLGHSVGICVGSVIEFGLFR
jgi:hypothetical protein